MAFRFSALLASAALTGACFASVAPARASQSLPVKNALFQHGSTAKSQIPDWTTSANKGNFGIYSDKEHYRAGFGVPAGSKTAYLGINLSREISQVLNARYATGQSYTLSAYAGESNKSKADSAVFGFYDATALPASSTPNPTNDLYHGSFTPTKAGYTLMRVSYTASKRVSGHRIGIYFYDNGGGTETVHVADVSVHVGKSAAH